MEWASEVYINDVDDAEGMRRACGLARQILVLAGDLSKVSIENFMNCRLKA